ncbi:MAG: hypothetical protein HYY16_13845 [Planctomycetes bacterium]|nr:hypothetical protein [Planctomycetota bacterium]
MIGTLLLCTGLACAAQQSVTVRVTAVSGESVYLDQGRDAGLQPGDRVLLYSSEHGILTATVQVVSRSSARCTLDTGPMALDVGTGGEVLLPPRQPEPNDGRLTQEERPTLPEHPPWTAPPEEWDRENPLLAPAFSRRPEERPTQVNGRAYVRTVYTRTQEPNDNEYVQARGGTDLTVVNPVPWGGTLHLRSELLYEQADVEDAEGDRETSPRLDRLSYAWGGLRGQPFRAEFGRFLQHEFPELGVIDGVEAAARLIGASKVGMSLGAMPDVTRSLELGETAQSSLFGRYAVGKDEDLTLGLAYQKTWFDGDRDRDLLLGIVSFTPSTSLFVRGSAWLDYYTSSEQEKPSGFELTEAHLQGLYRFDPQHGIGANISRIRRPELLSDELSLSVAEELLELGTFRYGLFTWQQLSDRVLVDGRINQWIDQDDERGTNGEVRLALQNLLFSRSEIALAAYYTDGAFNSGPGVRFSVSRFLPPVSFTFWYDVARYESTSSQDALTQQSLHVSLDGALSSTWTVFLSGDYQFGDDQDSSTWTLSVQKRI